MLHHVVVALADKVSTNSLGRAYRTRTRADSTQTDASDATQSTIQNKLGFTRGEQTQRKNQTNSDTEKQHPTARTTRQEPVDGIDTS